MDGGSLVGDSRSGTVKNNYHFRVILAQFVLF